MTGTSASELAAATPASRDRYVDLLRVVALGMVMLGHFLMAGVVLESDGAIRVTNTLSVVPQARILTWAFQVMPVFFFVGGFSHATALASLDRKGGTYADFVRSRVSRLLRPTIAFVTVWVAAAVVLELTGTVSPDLEAALRLVGQPLWFVGIYLAVATFAPWMLRLHRRYGVAVLVVLAVATAVTDVLRVGLDVPVVGYLTFAFVWLAVHQGGFFYADGSLLRGGRRLAWALAVAGYAAAAALVAVLPYPLSMVSLPGEQVSNMTPPSLALLALAVGEVGLVLLLRDATRRRLERRRVWTVVVAANGVAMTAFLWHLSAIVAVNGSLVLAGTSFPPIGSWQWWLLRVPLLLACAAVLAVLVAVFRRWERPVPYAVPDGAVRRVHRDGLAALGAAAALLGVLGFSVTGFAGVTTFGTAELVVLPMTPVVDLVLLVLGAWLVGWAAGGRQTVPEPVH